LYPPLGIPRQSLAAGLHYGAILIKAPQIERSKTNAGAVVSKLDKGGNDGTPQPSLRLNGERVANTWRPPMACRML
jgi:hypothetical protein